MISAYFPFSNVFSCLVWFVIIVMLEGFPFIGSIFSRSIVSAGHCIVVLVFRHVAVFVVSPASTVIGSNAL